MSVNPISAHRVFSIANQIEFNTIKHKLSFLLAFLYLNCEQEWKAQYELIKSGSTLFVKALECHSLMTLSPSFSINLYDLRLSDPHLRKLASDLMKSEEKYEFVERLKLSEHSVLSRYAYLCKDEIESAKEHAKQLLTDDTLLESKFFRALYASLTFLSVYNNSQISKEEHARFISLCNDLITPSEATVERFWSFLLESDHEELRIAAYQLGRVLLPSSLPSEPVGLLAAKVDKKTFVERITSVVDMLVENESYEQAFELTKQALPFILKNQTLCDSLTAFYQQSDIRTKVHFYEFLSYEFLSNDMTLQNDLLDYLLARNERPLSYNEYRTCTVLVESVLNLWTSPREEYLYILRTLYHAALHEQDSRQISLLSKKLSSLGKREYPAHDENEKDPLKAIAEDLIEKKETYTGSDWPKTIAETLIKSQYSSHLQLAHRLIREFNLQDPDRIQALFQKASTTNDNSLEAELIEAFLASPLPLPQETAAACWKLIVGMAVKHKHPALVIRLLESSYLTFCQEHMADEALITHITDLLIIGFTKLLSLSDPEKSRLGVAFYQSSTTITADWSGHAAETATSTIESAYFKLKCKLPFEEECRLLINQLHKKGNDIGLRINQLIDRCDQTMQNEWIEALIPLLQECRVKGFHSYDKLKAVNLMSNATQPRAHLEAAYQFLDIFENPKILPSTIRRNSKGKTNQRISQFKQFKRAFVAYTETHQGRPEHAQIIVNCLKTAHAAVLFTPTERRIWIEQCQSCIAPHQLRMMMNTPTTTPDNVLKFLEGLIQELEDSPQGKAKFVASIYPDLKIYLSKKARSENESAQQRNICLLLINYLKPLSHKAPIPEVRLQMHQLMDLLINCSLSADNMLFDNALSDILQQLTAMIEHKMITGDQLSHYLGNSLFQLDRTFVGAEKPKEIISLISAAKKNKLYTHDNKNPIYVLLHLWLYGLVPNILEECDIKKVKGLLDQYLPSVGERLQAKENKVIVLRGLRCAAVCNNLIRHNKRINEIKNRLKLRKISLTDFIEQTSHSFNEMVSFYPQVWFYSSDVFKLIIQQLNYNKLPHYDQFDKAQQDACALSFIKVFNQLLKVVLQSTSQHPREEEIRKSTILQLRNYFADCIFTDFSGREKIDLELMESVDIWMVQGNRENNHFYELANAAPEFSKKDIYIGLQLAIVNFLSKCTDISKTAPQHTALIDQILFGYPTILASNLKCLDYTDKMKTLINYCDTILKFARTTIPDTDRRRHYTRLLHKSVELFVGTEDFTSKSAGCFLLAAEVFMEKASRDIEVDFSESIAPSLEALCANIYSQAAIFNQERRNINPVLRLANTLLSKGDDRRAELLTIKYASFKSLMETVLNFKDSWQEDHYQNVHEMIDHFEKNIIPFLEPDSFDWSEFENLKSRSKKI